MLRGTGEHWMHGQRIYTYTDDEGNTYWSFTRREQTVSPSLRLTLKSRIGTHILNFVGELRQQAQTLWAERGQTGVESPER